MTIFHILTSEDIDVISRFFANLKAFVQKGPIFCFFTSLDWANFWQTDLFWHEPLNIAKSVLLICTSFLSVQKIMCAKNSVFWVPSFGVKKLWRWIWRDANLSNNYFCQLWQHGVLQICFYLWKKLVEKESRKKSDWPCIKPMSRQNNLEYNHFSVFFACTNKATVRE